MKRFTVSILCVAVFFIGLGGLVERAGARFKSDDRALEVIKQARIAIGGEDAIKQVKSLTLAARAAQTFTFDGASKTEQGDVEINMQLPDRLAKTMRFGNGDGGTDSSEKTVNHSFVIIKKDGDAADFKVDNPDGANKKIIIKKGGDADEEILKQVAGADGAHKIIINRDARVSHDGDGAFRQNELFRLAFALLLTAPEGLDVSYTYAGEGAVDGNDCDIIAAQAAGDASTIKLYIGKSSHLPVMLSYQAIKPFMIKFKKEDAAAASGENKDVKFFVRRAEDAPVQTAEYQVKFSDYRSVGGVMLPFRWTQTADGQADQTLDVSSYEINPAGIADKFEKSLPRVVMMKKQQ